MSDWLPVISAASGLAGAAIGGGITYLAQFADRKDRARGELAATLVAFGYALDALHIEIGRIPRSTWVARVTDEAINERRFPNLNHLLVWANMKTIGRDAQRAVDRYMAEGNRVLLLAPIEFLPVLEQANQLLTRASARDEDWDRDWAAMRAQLTVESRKLVGSKVGQAVRETRVTRGGGDVNPVGRLKN